MSREKKILEFKLIKYGFEELVYNYCSSEKDEFKEGYVTNLLTGEEFDINKLPEIYIEMNQGVVDASEHLTYYQRSLINRVLNNSINKYKEKLLCKKLEEDTITKEELEEYIFLVDRRDIKSEFENNKGVRADIINTFIKVNQELPIAREVSLANIGRYYRLLEVLIHKNKILNKPHGNSNEPSKKELMEYLECKSENTFRVFIQEMEQFNIARRFKLPNNRNIIFINPLYAHKDLIISKELFNVFKDVLEQKLDKRILKYLELVYGEYKIDGSICYSEK